MSVSAFNSTSATVTANNQFAGLADVKHNLSAAEVVEDWPADKKLALFAALDRAGYLKYLKFYWPFWARPDQCEPKGKWVNWIVQAGRGFGKTRVGAEQVRKWHYQVPITHVIAPTASDIHKVILDGPAGINNICMPQERPHFQTKDSTLIWNNGAKTLLFSAEEPERLRGPQCYKMWCDELPAWKYAQKTWDNAVFGLRMGDNPQCVITTTPRPIPLFKQLVKEEGTVVTRGSTRDNIKNLSKRFINEVVKKYKGTRLGRQELDGELLEDNPGALWTLSMIDVDRIQDPEFFWKNIFETLTRVVVGVDPAVTSNADSDETGIVTVGRDKQRPPHFYVFDDRSCIDRPRGWAERAIAAYKQFEADRIVAEANNGGEMVKETIQNVDKNAAVTLVHASRGKITRAEPVSALYEQHRVHHVGALPDLEDQMCDYDPATASFSPDRMDAVVWAVTDLMEGDHAMLDYWDTLIAEQRAKDQNAVPLPRNAQTAEEKEEAGLRKISTIGKLSKPATSSLAGKATPSCPKCGNVSLTRGGDGYWRCGACGTEGRDPHEGAVFRKIVQ